MFVINYEKFCDELACLSSDTDWIRDESRCYLKAVSRNIQETFSRGEIVTNEKHTFVWDKDEFTKQMQEMEASELRYSKYLRGLFPFAFENGIEK